MKIVIIGGSNSQLAQGYQAHLRTAHPDTEIVNLSVGAAPSLMGMYRLLSSDKIAPGDLLIWEYALNDLNHIAGKGYDPQLLLRYVEYTIRFAHQHGLGLLPLIFVPRQIENGPASDPYRDGLRALFAHYGLTALDMSSHLRQHLGLRRVPHEFYRDVNHYAINDTFLAPILAIVETVVANPDAARPAPVGPLIAPADRGPAVHTQADSGQEVEFKNALMQVPAWSIETGPVTFRSLPAGTELVGLLVVASAAGGAVRLRAGTTDVTLSLCHDESKFGKPLLKLIALPNLLPETPRIDAESPVTFEAADHDGSTLYDMGFRPVATDAPTGAQGRIVALLTEHSLQADPETDFPIVPPPPLP